MCHEVYLFECDADWREALEATFYPWRNKVHIINKYVSSINDAKNISLDVFFHDRVKPSLVKMDVEGMEMDVLNGARQLLQQKSILELLICTYHNKDDQKELSDRMKGYAYTISYSCGYMTMYWDWLKETLNKSMILDVV